MECSWNHSKVVVDRTIGQEDGGTRRPLPEGYGPHPFDGPVTVMLYNTTTQHSESRKKNIRSTEAFPSPSYPLFEVQSTNIRGLMPTSALSTSSWDSTTGHAFLNGDTNVLPCHHISSFFFISSLSRLFAPSSYGPPHGSMSRMYIRLHRSKQQIKRRNSSRPPN